MDIRKFAKEEKQKISVLEQQTTRKRKVLDKLEEFYVSEAYQNLIQQYDEKTLCLKTYNGKIYISSKTNAFVQDPDMSIRTYKWFPDDKQVYFEVLSLKKEIFPEVLLFVNIETSGLTSSYLDVSLEKIDKSKKMITDLLRQNGWCEELIAKAQKSFCAGSEMKRHLEELTKKKIKDQVI